MRSSPNSAVCPRKSARSTGSTSPKRTRRTPDDKIAIEDAPSHLQDIKDKLRNFGAVNLLALEEYKVASEREKFLNEQLGRH